MVVLMMIIMVLSSIFFHRFYKTNQQQPQKTIDHQYLSQDIWFAWQQSDNSSNSCNSGLNHSSALHLHLPHYPDSCWALSLDERMPSKTYIYELPILYIGQDNNEYKYVFYNQTTLSHQLILELIQVFQAFIHLILKRNQNFVYSIHQDSIALSEEDTIRRCEVETSFGTAVPTADVSIRAQPDV